MKESGSHANLPILAPMLVAKTRRFGETVKVALLGLPFAIEGSQSFLETFCAKSVRVPIDVRVPASPCSIASYALIHHKPFLVLNVFCKMTYFAALKSNVRASGIRLHSSRPDICAPRPSSRI